MKYIIEFELPDNETVLKEIKTDRVNWSIWGYSGQAKAKPTLKEQETGQIPEKVNRDRMCEVYPDEWVRKGSCPHCDKVVHWFTNRKYCGFCGKAVKWE